MMHKDAFLEWLRIAEDYIIFSGVDAALNACKEMYEQIVKKDKDELQKETQKLRAVLEFYGDDRSYLWPKDINGQKYSQPEIMFDFGKKAKGILKKENRVCENCDHYYDGNCITANCIHAPYAIEKDKWEIKK